MHSKARITLWQEMTATAKFMVMAKMWWIGHTRIITCSKQRENGTYPVVGDLSFLTVSASRCPWTSQESLHTLRWVVGLASLFFLVIIWPSNSSRCWPKHWLVFSPSKNPTSLWSSCPCFFARTDPKSHLRLPLPWLSPWQPLSRHIRAKFTFMLCNM